MISDEELRNSIIRAQYRIFGKNLIGIQGENEGNKIFIVGYFDTDPSEDEIENLKIIGSEIIADFPKVEFISEKWKIGWPETKNHSIWVENKNYNRPTE